MNGHATTTLVRPLARLSVREARELGEALGPFWVAVYRGPSADLPPRVDFYQLGCERRPVVLS